MSTPERRTDEDTGLATEYALFLAETRGVNYALQYLDSRSVPRETLLRAIQVSGGRRNDERRRQQRG